MVNKFQQFREAIRNPPPARLAAIEYRSHALNILGVLIVTVILVAKGFWYIIFAFIFSLGVSYANMISSYMKYQALKEVQPLDLPNLEKDPSPTRRRSRIIEEQFGKSVKWLVSIISVIIAMFFIPFHESIPWYTRTAFGFLVLFIWIILYYFPTFWIAQALYFRSKIIRRLKHDKRKKD